MASFDITDAAGDGYALVWSERRYLFRLAAVPIVIKLCCLMVLSGLGWEQDFVKQALVLLPSYLADGWMVSHVVRLILFDQRWPFKPTGNPEKDVARLHERARGIMGGTLVYGLTEYLVTGLIGLLFVYGQPYTEEPPDNRLLYTAVALAVVTVVVWAFRLLWLYIPAAAGFSPKAFLSKVKGMTSSFYFIGVWLICLIPVFLFFRFLVTLVVAPYDSGMENLPFLPDFAVTALVVLMDTVIALLVTAGMTHGIKQIYSTGSGQSADS